MTKNNDATRALQIFDAGYIGASSDDLFHTYDFTAADMATIRTELLKSAQVDALQAKIDKYEEHDLDVWVKLHDKLFDENKSLKAQVDGLVKALTDYYVPQLKFSMGGHRAFATEHADNKEISASHHGAANAFETAIGCIEEALQQFSATEI